MALWRLGYAKTSSTTNVTLVQASRVAGKVGGEVDLFPPLVRRFAWQVVSFLCDLWDIGTFELWHVMTSCTELLHTLPLCWIDGECVGIKLLGLPQLYTALDNVSIMHMMIEAILKLFCRQDSADNMALRSARILRMASEATGLST